MEGNDNNNPNNPLEETTRFLESYNADSRAQLMKIWVIQQWNEELKSLAGSRCTDSLVTTNRQLGEIVNSLSHKMGEGRENVPHGFARLVTETVDGLFPQSMLEMDNQREKRVKREKLQSQQQALVIPSQSLPPLAPSSPSYSSLPPVHGPISFDAVGRFPLPSTSGQTAFNPRGGPVIRRARKHRKRQ